MRRVSFVLGAICLLSGSGLYGQEAIEGRDRPLALTQDGHQRVNVPHSKRRCRRGAKNHRRLIQEYQEKWNEGSEAFDSFFNGLNSKQKRSILRHALKRHDKDRPIIQRIERDMGKDERARARKTRRRQHFSN